MFLAFGVLSPCISNCIGSNSDLFATQNLAASFMTLFSYWNAPLQAQWTWLSQLSLSYDKVALHAECLLEWHWCVEGFKNGSQKALNPKEYGGTGPFKIAFCPCILSIKCLNDDAILMPFIVSESNDFSRKQLEELEGGRTLQTGLEGQERYALIGDVNRKALQGR